MPQFFQRSIYFMKKSFSVVNVALASQDLSSSSVCSNQLVAAQFPYLHFQASLFFSLLLALIPHTAATLLLDCYTSSSAPKSATQSSLHYVFDHVWHSIICLSRPFQPADRHWFALNLTKDPLDNQLGLILAISWLPDFLAHSNFDDNCRSCPIFQ